MEINYKAWADSAVTHAKSLGDFTLDYTAESIDEVEYILSYIHSKKDMFKDEEQLFNFSRCYGIYIGETMLRNGLSDYGYSWKNDGDMDVLVLEKSQISPITKVLKRIQNGLEDNVASFYKIVIEFVQGKIPTEKVHRSINVEMSTNQNVIDMGYKSIGGLIDFLGDKTLSWIKLNSHDGSMMITALEEGYDIEIVINKNMGNDATYEIKSINLADVKEIVLQYYKNITEETLIDGIKGSYPINKI